jgi:hypothetical protein
MALGTPAVLSLPRDVSPGTEETLRAELEELFPELRAEPEGIEMPILRFAFFTEHEGSEHEVPPEASNQAFRIQVGPAGIDVVSGSPAGWLPAARALRGLREGDELAGVELLDWPSFPARQIDLPWEAESLSEAAFQLCLSLLARGRLNRLGLPGADQTHALPETIQDMARQAGIELVAPARHPSFWLVEAPRLFPDYSRLLPTLRETALAAEVSGESAWAVTLGALDPRTSLEALAYGVLYAGDCGWNPQKADPKSFRRWYSARRHGFDSRSPLQVVDELEGAAAEVERADPTLGLALEAAPPFQSEPLAGLLRPQERVSSLGQKASTALAALAPLQPDSAERAAALQGWQWSAQRLKALSRRLGVEERVRDLYRSAYAATASPKAVSERLLKAAELLEAEAQATDEYRAEWHALWRRERAGAVDAATEGELRSRVEALKARADRMRDLRNRYIQTGSLPAPAAEGLELTGTHLSAGLLPMRLPPQPSPAWWPEGGAARLRLEVDCPEPAAGMVWAVQADFRALAGESGAFNVRSARLLPLTENDQAGTELPCQLTRGGFAFIPHPGRHPYFLYLDPEPGPPSGFREVRAGQSRAAVRLENRHLRLSLSPAHGFVSGIRLLEPGLELLPPEKELEEGEEHHSSEWRLRILETGPLLGRVCAEHGDGRIRQIDLGAGQEWAEISANSPWTEFLIPDRPDLWSEGAVALFEEKGAVTRFPLEETASEVTETRWAAQYRSDGLTLGALLPDAPAHAAVAGDAIRLWGRPHGARVLLFASQTADPTASFTRLLIARQQPPQVRIGVVEERRVREF